LKEFREIEQAVEQANTPPVESVEIHPEDEVTTEAGASTAQVGAEPDPVPTDPTDPESSD
jgi:hypothetical protein